MKKINLLLVCLLTILTVSVFTSCEKEEEKIDFMTAKIDGTDWVATEVLLNQISSMYSIIGKSDNGATLITISFPMIANGNMDVMTGLSSVAFSQNTTLYAVNGGTLNITENTETRLSGNFTIDASIGQDNVPVTEGSFSIKIPE